MTNALYNISNRILNVQINSSNSQVVSVTLDDKKHQYIWPGGKPEYAGFGWRNSDLIMFPILGPVPENRLLYGTKFCTMTQHGLTRHLPWSIDHDSDDETLKLIQTYEHGTLVPVSSNGKLVEIYWPFSFKLISSFEVKENELHERLEIFNGSEEPMPYSVGRHPAFNLPQRTYRSKIEIEDKKDKFIMPLSNIRSLPNCVAFLDGAQFVRFMGEENREIFLVELEFPDFGNVVLWSPSNTPYIAIEPVMVLPEVDAIYEPLDKRKGAKILNPFSQEIYSSVLKFA